MLDGHDLNGFINETAKVLATLDAETLAKAEESATLDAADWEDLGDKATRGQLAGVFTLSAAQRLYGIHSRFNNGATLAERVVYLLTMNEAMPRTLAVG